MTSTLLDIPFDHYQRYAAAAHLLQTLALEAPSVLEVGANRQRLLGQFLPQATFLYTDLHVEGDEKDFVVADATALPFADQQFEAVVSLDVLEHIPAHLRTRAIAEMARVAGRAVIVGFPPRQPWVEQAEVEANGRWHELFGEDYVWLQEHKEFGLVETSEVVQTFEAAGMEVLRFGQGNATLWASLMGAHFIKVKFPELEPLVEAADRLYNSRVFAGDHSDEPYREYYVAVRRDADAARLRANPPFQAGSDQEATALLSGLAQGLRALALRTNNSEREWKSTARMLDAYIADLEAAKREWGATAAYAHQLQAAKDESDAGWLARQAEGALTLQHAQDEIRGLGQVIARRDDELVQAEARLQLEREGHAQQRMALELEREGQVQERSRLEHRLLEDAAAYARSRRKWKLAMMVLGFGGVLAGYALAWATL
jgi:hypothetical protein